MTAEKPFVFPEFEEKPERRMRTNREALAQSIRILRQVKAEMFQRSDEARAQHATGFNRRFINRSAPIRSEPRPPPVLVIEDYVQPDAQTEFDFD